MNNYWDATTGIGVTDHGILADDDQCDVAIIGGGYTGLSAALHLARDHGIDARVLEADTIGSGASGRNGGFCCLGSHKMPYQTQIRRFGVEAARDFMMAQCAAVELVAELIDAEGMEVDRTGDGETLVAHRGSRVQELIAERDILKGVFGIKGCLQGCEELRERGLGGPIQHGGLHIPIGFALHPGKYVRSLANAALHHGARIHTRTPVSGWEHNGSRHQLITEEGTMTAERVLIATNGYTSEQLFSPVRGALLRANACALTTRPLSRDELAAEGWHSHDMVFDTKNLLNWFRLLPDGRMIFGGRGGFDYSDAGHERDRARLQHQFARAFPAWAQLPVTHAWTGFVCLALDRLPHLGPVGAPGSGVYAALAYHGNGVAAATWSGRAMARLIAAGKDAARIPAIMTQRLKRFPLRALRPWYLRGAYLAFGLRDRLP
ncbi:MAG: FAD-binding oxidoreductase [Gammaproteobacteria bacterium]|nr:FAD-binding oxidoreductase [Gammaproteobacteria bacterium]